MTTSLRLSIDEIDEYLLHDPTRDHATRLRRAGEITCRREVDSMNPEHFKKSEKMRLEYAAARDLFIELSLSPEAATWLRNVVWRQFHGLSSVEWITTMPALTRQRALALLVYFGRRNPKQLKTRLAFDLVLARLAHYGARPTPASMLVAWDKLVDLGLAHDEDGNPHRLAEVWARWQLVKS